MEEAPVEREGALPEPLACGDGDVLCPWAALATTSPSGQVPGPDTRSCESSQGQGN